MYVSVNNQQRVHRNFNRLDKNDGFHPHRDAIATSFDHQPESAGSLRRHIAASLMRHHQSAERNKHALQPLSPASYSSSLEIAPYNPVATPGSSIELRGKIGDSSYSFKTSTELLKVLNRIWSLEEQHVSNVSLVKALKTDLDLARARIKELLRDQQSNRHEIDDLMKQISEDTLARKSKEQERLDSALQSAKKELEDERKLRKRSESLHRKLGRELYDVKVALASSMKNLDKERKSNELLEELCDEFAEGIREYAGQVQVDWTGKADHENLILHISESWLDERLQMKDREAQFSTNQNSSVIDKMSPEIGTFLAARQVSHLRNKDTSLPRSTKERHLRRRSLESIPEAMSAPQNIIFEESGLSDSRHVEKSKVGHSTHQSPPSVKISDPQNTPREIDPSFMKTGEGTLTEISMLQKSDVYDSIQRKNPYNDEGHGSNSRTVDKLISELLSSEGGNFPIDYEYKEVASTNSALRRNASPVRQWLTNMTSPDPRNSESYTKIQQQVKVNANTTLKSKLQEPKLKGQRSRLKILKGLS